MGSACCVSQGEVTREQLVVASPRAEDFTDLCAEAHESPQWNSSYAIRQSHLPQARYVPAVGTPFEYERLAFTLSPTPPRTPKSADQLPTGAAETHVTQLVSAERGARGISEAPSTAAPDSRFPSAEPASGRAVSPA